MFVCALTLTIQLTCAAYVQSQQLEGWLLERASAAEEQANAATELVAQIHSHSLVVDAAKALIESRRALKYSYVQAYYTRPGPTLHLLEHLQGRLEADTEALAELLERPPNDICTQDPLAPHPLVLLAAAARQRRAAMLAGLHEGLLAHTT
jgi:hypothetical protein